MYCISKMASIVVIIPISLLLALSFFVLLSIDKAQTKRLKTFGYGVAVILWLAVLVIISGGVYRLAKGGNQAKYMMHKEMMMHREGMPGMHPKQMPGEMNTK